jgi:hypothetical protein
MAPAWLFHDAVWPPRLSGVEPCNLRVTLVLTFDPYEAAHVREKRLLNRVGGRSVSFQPVLDC